MTHPLVDQLLFARREWLRGLEGITAEEGEKHFGQMNCISWIVGHLGAQEQAYLSEYPQGLVPYPRLKDFATGSPMSTPALSETLDLWTKTTAAVSPYVEALTTEALIAETFTQRPDRPRLVGSLILRVIYHYWYHIGEIQSIRQLLGHRDLPDFVGPIHEEAPYRAEP